MMRRTRRAEVDARLARCFLPKSHGPGCLTPNICLARSGPITGALQPPRTRFPRPAYCQPAIRRTADVRAKGKSAMDRRRLLLILAVFVAIIVTALVFLYVQGADTRAGNKFDNVSVLKATQDIAAGEKYDSALAAGKISSADVPRNQLNTGYQTSTTALKGKIASVPV